VRRGWATQPVDTTRLRFGRAAGQSMIAQAFLASTAIILLSFVSEDAATISSSLSIFGGPLSWPLGFATCFAGIWLGDLGLYWLARYLGKPVLQSRWVARFVDASTIERCQEKFNQHGSLTLLTSRFVPGTRLPTYLAAGLLSMPVARFALVTAFAALLWIGGVFAIAELLGAHALIWFSFIQGKIAAIVFTALLVGAAILLLAGVAVLHSRRRLLPVARGSLSWFQRADCSKSRDGDWRIHRRIKAGDSQRTSWHKS